MKKIYFKILGSVSFASICGISSYFYFQNFHTDPDKVLSVNKSNLVNQLLTADHPTTQKDTITNNLKQIPHKESYILISPSELSETEIWLKDKGYFPNTDVDIYNTYSDDTLKNMAKNGDLIALNVLSTRSVVSGNEKEATLYMNLSVLYGSTAALDNLTIYTSPKAPYDTTEQERKPASIETLAVIDVIARRGDMTLSQVSRDSFLRSYKRLYGSDLQLTSEEIQAIHERSQVIYEAFQQIRIKKGLGEFDNTEPIGVKKFFGMQ